MSDLKPGNDQPLTLQQQREASYRAGWLWGTIVVLLLGSQVAIGIAAVVLASGDPSVAIVPGYHDKALVWDETAERRRQSDRLGWTVFYDLRSESPTLRITDAAGTAIDGLSGTLTLYHHARAASPRVVGVGRRSEQGYPVALPFDRVGLWQFDLDLSSETGTRFVHTRTIDVRQEDLP